MLLRDTALCFKHINVTTTLFSTSTPLERTHYAFWLSSYAISYLTLGKVNVTSPQQAIVARKLETSIYFTAIFSVK